jgi:hypothetical protein
MCRTRSVREVPYAFSASARLPSGGVALPAPQSACAKPFHVTITITITITV